MKNIDKEFVPYQEALALKELGFDESCLGFYEFGSMDKEWHLRTKHISKNEYDDDDVIYVLKAPTYSQAFRFFRENYGLKHDIDDDNVGTKFYYKIRSYTDKFDNYDDIIKPMREERDWSKIEFYSYEETELACLKKLIEIVKNN